VESSRSTSFGRWQVLAGEQAVSGASPTTVVVFLAVAGIAIAAFGFHVIRKGF
jgi:hypothetical protein